MLLAVNQLTACLESDHIYPVFSSQTKNNGLMGYYTDYLNENAMYMDNRWRKYRGGKVYETGNFIVRTSVVSCYLKKDLQINVSRKC